MQGDDQSEQPHLIEFATTRLLVGSESFDDSRLQLPCIPVINHANHSLHGRELCAVYSLEANGKGVSGQIVEQLDAYSLQLSLEAEIERAVQYENTHPICLRKCFRVFQQVCLTSGVYCLRLQVKVTLLEKSGHRQLLGKSRTGGAQRHAKSNDTHEPCTERFHEDPPEILPNRDIRIWPDSEPRCWAENGLIQNHETDRGSDTKNRTGGVIVISIIRPVSAGIHVPLLNIRQKVPDSGNIGQFLPSGPASGSKPIGSSCSTTSILEVTKCTRIARRRNFQSCPSFFSASI